MIWPCSYCIAYTKNTMKYLVCINQHWYWIPQQFLPDRGSIIQGELIINYCFCYLHYLVLLCSSSFLLSAMASGFAVAKQSGVYTRFNSCVSIFHKKGSSNKQNFRIIYATLCVMWKHAEICGTWKVTLKVPNSFSVHRT